MRPFSHGATSSWIGNASSLACSRPPPQRHARGWRSGPNLENCDLFHARSPAPGHRARCSRPFVAGELGRRLQVLVSRVKCEGARPHARITRTRAPTSPRSTGFVPYGVVLVRVRVHVRVLAVLLEGPLRGRGNLFLMAPPAAARAGERKARTCSLPSRCIADPSSDRPRESLHASYSNSNRAL